MAVNYEDERLQNVETEKQAALSEVEKTYGGMIDGVDEKYQGLIDASEEWKNTQSQIQQEQTDFTIEQIEQQKEQEQKDYTKEQSGAYVDWQKQSAQHGANAEQMAAMGMTGTGYSESSQVSMYNTYQNRVATARASYDAAVLNYNNAIKEARLQNSSALAEIAYKALQQQLELTLEGFQHKNSLILEQTNKKAEVENAYYGRYLDVLNQLNTEAALAEEQRQFDLSMQENANQVFAQWKAYLTNAYPDGNVTDKDLWKQLVDAYGEKALKDAGFSQGDKIKGGADNVESLAEGIEAALTAPQKAADVLKNLPNILGHKKQTTGTKSSQKNADGTYTIAGTKLTEDQMAAAIANGTVKYKEDPKTGAVTFYYPGGFNR